MAEFATTVRRLLGLRDWLEAHGVEQVAMEATGVYWKAPWAVLEDDFECVLVNAQHVKQVPGRKTDVSDAEWLCRLVEASSGCSTTCPTRPRADAPRRLVGLGIALTPEAVRSSRAYPARAP